ncbi:hypothetical protein KRP22_006709 [Phytophthora ramorum]|nr:hypothetical protein KRP22_2160 [Phytophthora ramorum]
MILTVASSAMTRAIVDGKAMGASAYSYEDRGMLELVVNGYPNGKLSNRTVKFDAGDELAMRSVIKFEYKNIDLSVVIASALQMMKEQMTRRMAKWTRCSSVGLSRSLTQDELKDLLKWSNSENHLRYVTADS